MDILTKAVTKDGFIRIYAVNSKETVAMAQEIHHSTPVVTAALGRTLTGAMLMGAMQKDESIDLTLQLKGLGPAGLIIAVAKHDGFVKGYVENPAADLPLNSKGKLDVGGVVGTNGYLSVVKDLKMKEPYIGKVPLQTGEVGDDLAFYFAQSEQVPTAVALGVLIDKDLSVKAAGGFIIQVMPDCDEFTLKRLEKTVEKITSVTELLSSGISSEELIKTVMKDFDTEILESTSVGYRCDCSRERTARAIKSLGKDEIRSILEEEGQAEVTCHFCNKSYVFDKSFLEKILSE